MPGKVKHEKNLYLVIGKKYVISEIDNRYRIWDVFILEILDGYSGI